MGKQASALSTDTKDWSVSAFAARKDVQSGELSLGRSLSLSSFVRGCHGDGVGLPRRAHNFQRACLDVTRPFQPGIV